MTLAVGDLCTVVYAEGGVKVALPVDIAGINQQAFLSDYNLSQTGVPLRLRSVSEIAATVPEDPNDPRLQRVVGTLARDASGSLFFAPLGVIPTATAPEPGGTKVFFIVFADTSPIALLQSGGEQVPQAFVYRTPGEFDYFEATIVGARVFKNIDYTTNVIDAEYLGNGYFREFYRQSPITTRLQQVDAFGDFGVQKDEFATKAVGLGTTRTYRVTYGVVTTRTMSYDLAPGIFPDVDAFILPLPIRTPAARTFQTEYRYYPTALQQLRQSLTQWTTPPKAIVYHVPLQSDAVEGTPAEILPLGTTDYSPLEIINSDYPSATDVVAKIASEAGEDGVREVRFFTAMASLDAVARVTALIAEIEGALDSAYENVAHTTTVSPNNNWLGALVTSAQQIPT